MSELPKGWVQTNLGEVLFFNYGKSLAAAKRKGGNIDVYGSNGVVGQHNEAITQSPAIIVGRKGSFGEVHFSNARCFPIDTTYFVDEFPATEAKYAYSLLKHLPLKEMNRATVIPGLNREDAHSLPIPLPPLPEQRRIVKTLDTLSTHTHTARTHLAAIAKLVERYRTAVLMSAFSGELTCEWRALNSPKRGVSEYLPDLLALRQMGWIEREVRKRPGADRKSVAKRYKTPNLDVPSELAKLPDTWRWIPTEVLSIKVVDGVHKKPHYVDDGVPFIMVKNMTAGPGISFEDTKFVTQVDHEEYSRRTDPEFGDILITKDGTLGVVRRVTTKQEFSLFVSVALVKPADKKLSPYLEYAYQAPQLQEQMTGVGSGLQHIHLTDLRKDCVPLAPIEEQREIVHRIETAFAKIDRLAAEAEKALKLTDSLDQRILAKAFAGELVPQDPNDEPANALLARIQKARTNAPKKPRKKPTKAKPMKVVPQERVLTDSVYWPETGLPFEDIAKRITLPHDDLKDAVFALLEGDTPYLSQEFDTDAKIMVLKRVAK